MSSGTREHSVLDTLNAAQCKAVGSKASTVAILAGPGSGKTHTLTSRVVWLVDVMGYRPEDVIVATFTVKAAREMKERIGRALGNGRERKIVLGTFHSIARRYLAAYGQRVGLNQKFGIADDSDSRAIISRICKRLQLGTDPVMARAWISKKKARGTEDIALSKRQDLNKVPGLRDLEVCYQEYQSHLERSNLLDYDDLLVRCVELLRKHPSCVSNIQAVLIDEYQDTNGVQYELMKLFAQRHNNITIVGDPDQSIYGWRSAEIRNLFRLLKDFPGTEEIALEENYRSFQSILDVSLRVIQQDRKRYQKVLLPIHNRGTRPVLRRLKSSSAEGEWIVSEIRRVLMMSGGMLGYDDVAVLLRSASLSRHVEAGLGKAGIAYRMVGGFKFYERLEIKIMLDYLRAIHQPDNNDVVARIMNVPKRGVGEATVKNLVEEAEKSSLSLWTLLVKHCRGDRTAKTNIKKQAEQKISGEFIRLITSIRRRIEEPSNGTPLGLVETIEQLLTQLKFQKFLEETYSEDHEQRWANIQEFISLANDFTKELGQDQEETLPEIAGVAQAKETDVLARFLANVSLASDVQTNDQDQEPKPLVTISTIHAAKGLEWPIVFVAGAYNGSIPHMRAEDGDEERRLLYVAMTRAKALLYLSFPLYGSQGSGEKLELCPFLSPISDAFLKKGPSLERHRLLEIGKVLSRDVPTEETIYKSLPPMVSPEDDLFPEDPEQSHRRGPTGVDAFGHDVESGPRSKRRKISGPMGSEVNGELGWEKEYSTTMEQSSKFTVGSLPGFVSAGAHQVAVAAQAAREALQEKPPAGKKSTARRPPDQRSLLGFVKRDSSRQPDLSVADICGPVLPNKSLGGFTGGGCAQPSKQGSRDSAWQLRTILKLSDEASDEKWTVPNSLGGFKRPAGLTRDGIAPLDRLRKPFKPLTINRQ
ncbi:ATP-dependent DNA helicase srs2 [Pleurostoma richardsiae]|uniref:DNA 3'-5' helicase n=1 Tax=Pleurostoma richardsiae TaxID=41990 RepID=A0AA38VTS9_9PEZI|nr:ATP-dependent DNA helicase srs2 [Pleurostoma richardsiae]